MPDHLNAPTEPRYHLLTADRPLSVEKILPRESLLAKIMADFRHYRFVLLHGKSGIGKTKLAELIFQRGQAQYAFAAWYRYTGDLQKDFYLQISDHVLLRQLETQIAFARQNNLRQDVIDQNCAHICRQYWEEQCPGPKLIVVDGVRDFQALLPYLPLLNITDAHVLITTQSLPQGTDVVQPYAVLEVPPFDSAELETMLHYFGQTIDDVQLAQYLGQSPLLLRLFLKNNTPEQPEKSRALVARLLKEAPEEDLDSRLIVALLDFADLPPAILWVLMQIAAMPDKFHDPDFIAAIIGLNGLKKPVYTQSYNIFKGKGRNRHTTDSVVQMEEILDWLKQRGWLEFNVFDEVHCHASLILPVRQFTKPRYDYFLEHGKQLDLTFFLNENGYDEERLDPADLRLHRVSDGELEQHLYAFINFVDDDYEDKFKDLLSRYAEMLKSKIKWREELPIRQRIFDIWQQEGTAEEEIMLVVMINLSDCFYRNGDYKKALNVCSEVLSRAEKILTLESIEIASIYNYLGMIHSKLGNHEYALAYKIKAVSIWEFVLSPWDETLAVSYDNIGITLSVMGAHQMALEYQIKALKIGESVWSVQHPDLAMVYNNISSTYHSLKVLDKALEYTEKALKIREAVLPPQHPDLAMAYDNMGSILMDSNNYREALECRLKALAIWEGIFSQRHPDLIILYNNLAYNYTKLNDLINAEKYRQLARAGTDPEV